MSWLLPLPVAIPLLTAAVIVAIDHLVPRGVKDALAIVAAAAATGCALVVLVQSERKDVIHWFGGWHPDSGVALGVGFTAEPFGAGMAALACALTMLALVFSWTYMREAARLYDVLMLVFCGAMAGFALTGDIFNMFVWFELMGVAAYALAGFNVEELGTLQGAVNFAITNTAGAYTILLGIGLLYARTGALNFAQIGEVLAGNAPDRLVIVALALVVVGFIVKGAIVPFHWWLADAHAVAPAPVCVLFSGVMVELGLLAVARVYWTVFDGPFHADPGSIRDLLVWLGVVTALVGAVMSLLQRHLKRMLAFSTISHAGAVLAGIGLLAPASLAGAANVVLSHGLLKSGLFLLCGVLLLQLRDVDELRLHGRGRRLRWAGALWLAGTLGLAGVPYTGAFLGHALIGDGAAATGAGWLAPALMVAEGVAAGALLRAGARVFLGWGPREDPLLTPEPAEHPSAREAAVPLMLALAGAATVLGLAASLVPGLQQRSELAAERFVDRAAYAGHVLHGIRPPEVRRPPLAIEAATASAWTYALGATALSLLVGAAALWHARLPELVKRAAARGLGPPVAVLRSAHSGVVGDYLLWFAVGSAVIGGVWSLTLR